ncbi:MAG: anthranilate phosphoribosyltransferase family protein [Phototrophicaceae bacterium]
MSNHLREKKSDTFRDLLHIIGRGRKLQRDYTREEAREIMQLLLGEQVSDAQIGAFLVTMRVKEETAEEIIGFVQATHDVMQAFPKPSVEGLLDIALPYNGKSRNLQTGVAVALVLAASGVPVLLHGADHIPTKNGIAILNLLRTLGYPADLPPEQVRDSIEQTNFGVLNIEHILPQWTALTPLRHHFGVRTLMNTVEKLINPADAPNHLSGFYHSSYLKRMATCLPAPNSWITQGDEGSIDIRPGKKTRVYKSDGETMIEHMLDAKEYGFPDELDLSMPIDPNAHADATLKALRGETGNTRDQIILTTGVLLWMFERVPDIHAGIDCARDTIDKGDALAILENAKQFA